MSHIQVTVELTKEEKLKKLNQKLNGMLQKKNILPSTMPNQSQVPLSQTITPEIKVTLKQTIIEPTITKNNEDSDAEVEGSNKTKLIHKKPKNTNLRKAAGTVWEDKTMQEWSPNDYRVFCGNLGNEVSDEILAMAFRQYKSFQKARVVRDKRSGKSKGYGFVSFRDSQDFLKALKQMNNKHVGNRPVKLTKSNWKDRELDSEKNQVLPSDFKTNSQKQTNKVFIDFKYVSPL